MELFNFSGFGSEELLKLLGNDRKYFDLNSVELIETDPSTGS
jgi:hypothetical protein